MYNSNDRLEDCLPSASKSFLELQSESNKVLNERILLFLLLLS